MQRKMPVRFCLGLLLLAACSSNTAGPPDTAYSLGPEGHWVGTMVGGTMSFDAQPTTLCFYGCTAFGFHGPGGLVGNSGGTPLSITVGAMTSAHQGDQVSMTIFETVGTESIAYASFAGVLIDGRTMTGTISGGAKPASKAFFGESTAAVFKLQ